MIITLAIAAALFFAVAVWKHVTLGQIKADVAKAKAKVSSIVVKGVAATKEDVKAAVADLKKWV